MRHSGICTFAIVCLGFALCDTAAAAQAPASEARPEPAVAAASHASVVGRTTRGETWPSASDITVGGRIVDRIEEDGQTCLQVVRQRLVGGKPVHSSSMGLFYACSTANLDAQQYSKGRIVTVSGKQAATQERVYPTCTSIWPDPLALGAVEIRHADDGCHVQYPVVQIVASQAWHEPPSWRGAP